MANQPDVARDQWRRRGSLASPVLLRVWQAPMPSLTRRLFDMPKLGQVTACTLLGRWLRSRVEMIILERRASGLLQSYLRCLAAAREEQRHGLGRILGMLAASRPGLHHADCGQAAYPSYWSPTAPPRSSGGHRPCWRRHRRGLHVEHRPCRGVDDDSQGSLNTSRRKSREFCRNRHTPCRILESGSAIRKHAEDLGACTTAVPAKCIVSMVVKFSCSPSGTKRLVHLACAISSSSHDDDRRWRLGIRSVHGRRGVFHLVARALAAVIPYRQGNLDVCN